MVLAVVDDLLFSSKIRAAGCDRVMARSAFVMALPTLLQPAGARTT